MRFAPKDRRKGFPRGRYLFAAALLISGAWTFEVPPARGQDIVEAFRNARIRRVAQEVAVQKGYFLPPRPPDHLPTRGDSLAAWLASFHPAPELEELPPPPPPLTIDSVRVFNRLTKVVFDAQFGDTRWAFMQGRRLAEIDTTRTVDMRARLEAHYGPPTVTLADYDSVTGLTVEDVVQFEYWMVVNDSIPVLIIDVNGPLGRGVVVATTADLRDKLDSIRYGLLQPLFDRPRRAPFVDYYLQADTRVWFVSGFDGASFFHRRIDRPNLKLGRPRLEEYVSDLPDR